VGLHPPEANGKRQIRIATVPNGAPLELPPRSHALSAAVPRKRAEVLEISAPRIRRSHLGTFLLRSCPCRFGHNQALYFRPTSRSDLQAREGDGPRFRTAASRSHVRTIGGIGELPPCGSNHSHTLP